MSFYGFFNIRFGVLIMKKIILVVPCLFFAPVVQSHQGYSWLDIAKAAYIQGEVERLGVKQTCGSIAQVGWNAAVERAKGRSHVDVSQDDSVYEDWHHPFINLQDWQRIAVDIAFDNYSASPDEVSSAINLQCGGGRGAFAELYEKLMTTQLTPAVSEERVLEFACTYYENWVGNLAYLKGLSNRPSWYSMERSVSTENGVIPYYLQVDIVNFLDSNEEISEERLKERIRHECFNAEGLFNIERD